MCGDITCVTCQQLTITETYHVCLSEGVCCLQGAPGKNGRQGDVGPAGGPGVQGPQGNQGPEGERVSAWTYSFKC